MDLASMRLAVMKEELCCIVFADLYPDRRE
jgi:hypothetical protein